VPFDGARADEEPGADVLVGEFFANQPNDVGLLWGELARIAAPGLDRAGHIAADPIRVGQPPVVGPLPPSIIDARGVDLSFTTDQSQPVLGMPGSRLGTPLTRIGIFGSTPEGGVSVGYTGSSNDLEDLHGTRHSTSFPTSNQPHRRHRLRLLAAPRTPISERDEPAASSVIEPNHFFSPGGSPARPQ
jgi:hypothetical protein